jgi:molybdenum cofactor biosynthesis protein B
MSDHSDGHEHGDDDHEGHEHGHGDDGHDGHEHGEPGTHEHHHHDREELGVAVLTVSSSRSLDDDAAGDRIVEALENAGHEVTTRDLVPDDYDTVQGTVERFVDRDDTDIVITTGGTGVTPDDVTVEAARPLFDKELPGFGELFRRRSYDEIGTMVVATRATAGVAGDVPVFSIPGSENAAALGAELIVASAGHLAGLAGRDDDDHAHTHEHDEHGDEDEGPHGDGHTGHDD